MPNLLQFIRPPQPIRSLAPNNKLAGGIRPELVRLSIGIEHIEDILTDLDQALEKA